MKPRRKDSGFALLVVFLLAACVAITLYMEIPRVAFQAERQRELLLIDRGNQFKRAIQVFCTDRVNNPTQRYPASIDELESFNNHRYLRHRYIDPMTGKDEWRLVHIQGGVLTDSVTTQQNPANGQTTSAGPSTPAYISSSAYIDGDGGGPGGGRAGGVTRAMGRRPSDSLQPGAPGDLGMTAGGSSGMQGYANGGNPAGIAGQGGFQVSTPGALNAGVPNQPGMPGQPGIPGQAGLPGLPGVPTGIQGAAGNPTAAQQPACTVYIGTCPQTPANGPTGIPGQGLAPQPGAAVNSQMGGVSPYSTVGGANGNPQGFGQPAVQVNPQAQTAAASMINNLLTQPRPNGMPQGMMGATVGGGIAGVASKFEAEGIMVINDRTAINEWEYIFDKTKYRAPPNPVSGTAGTPLQPMQGGNTGTPIGPNPGMGIQPGGPGGPPMPGRGPGQ